MPVTCPLCGSTGEIAYACDCHRGQTLPCPSDLHDRLAASHPKLVRGQVWCRTCGRTETVDSAQALATGWPTCCGETMTIDAPEER